MKAVEVAERAKTAGESLAHTPTAPKDRALLTLERLITERKKYLLLENARDIEKAEKAGLSSSLIQRLRIDDRVISDMQASIRDVVGLPDPVGEIVKTWKRPNGLVVSRMRIPIGVIFVIYESRPNVTVEAFSLCLKSGNCVILKGGSEASYSNAALYNLMLDALTEASIPKDVVHLVTSADRSYIYDLLKMEGLIDLVIPRGGQDLLRNVVEHSRIPVLKHYQGVCHIFVDKSANLLMARNVCLNAKVQKPATCNAMETLLVHEAVAETFLPNMAKELIEHGVALRGCPRTVSIVDGIGQATEQDWREEYLDLTLSVRVVRNVDEAISHIATYGSNHTDAIITEDYSNAWKFLRQVNSSLVLVNASTRLNDGYQLGLGAEMGISTTKLHAFGPMGLEELTVAKFVAFGDGQVRT
jgi:glutamate-5-semialdehyde dehydrogenase